MNTLPAWAALLVTAGLLILLFELFGTSSAPVRLAAAVVCALVTLRYIYWRVLFTMPLHQGRLQHIWSCIFLVAELCTLTSSLLIYLFMSRTISRSAQADAAANSPLTQAPTDVLIATYNESADILERTIVGAIAIQHPDLRVWVLDDGDRPWVRDLALSLGALYVARHKGKHAKAGNVNNGVSHALTTGRTPEFFLLLDADFIPNRHILHRVLGLFEDPAVGIVQTPQHFFNPDPVQSNLLCTAVWPDEQRFFFNVLMPCKDAWGAAFCCGTSAVLRAQAFIAAGGMATETVTEDMLTSFKFGEFGFRTIFLNERLSLGLAPESLVEFISQRSRWCLGAIQQLFTRWSFFGRGRLTLINRIAFFDTVLYWLASATFKIMLISAPALYWFTGTATLRASLPDLVHWMVPMIAANLIFMKYLAGNRVLPVMTDVTQLLSSFVICRTIISGLLRPFGRPFKVTAKGLSSSSTTVQWTLLWPYALLAVFTVIGTFTHTGHFSRAHGVQGYSFTILWSIVDAATLTLTVFACVEGPRRRRDERFILQEPAAIHLHPLSAGSAPATFPCTISNLSLGGAAVHSPDGWNHLIGPASLVLHSAADQATLNLPFTVVRRSGNLLTLQFHPDPWIRHALIRKLFTGDFHRDVESISANKVLRDLCYNLIS